MSTTTNIIYQSTAWSNGEVRSWSGHEDADPFDPYLVIAAGEGRNIQVLGDGYALMDGARARLYILANNYNASLEFNFVLNNSIDNLSLRIRSRHNAGGSCSNAFGGYGCVVRHESIEFGDETCHSGGTHRDFGTVDLPHNLANG